MRAKLYVRAVELPGEELFMWYVVQVVGGRERHVLQLVERFVDEGVLE